jgi:hypothetical protein
MFRKPGWTTNVVRKLFGRVFLQRIMHNMQTAAMEKCLIPIMNWNGDALSRDLSGSSRRFPTI